MVINSTVLIILLLVSPLAMFILHKKHTYCSMRRNSVISSFLETLESRSGHTKEINKNNRTGTYKSYPSYWPPAQLHTSHHTEANLGLTAVRGGYSNKSRALVNKCSLEKIVRGAHNVIYHHSIFYFWQNKKSLKIIDWSHRLSVQFYFKQTTFFIAQYTGRK